MPFTTSHPAIVLPLKRLAPNWFYLSGLIAGAMSPDLLYFLMLSTSYRGFSHSWGGLVTFCLPVGILFVFVFHWLVKYHLFINLPAPWDKHFSGLAVSEWTIKTIKQWVILIVSVGVGALSHFFWDSFTHSGGEMVVLLPFLKDSFWLFGREIFYFRLLQHLSTIFGGLAVLWYLAQAKYLPERTEQIEKRSAMQKVVFWAGGAVVSILFTVSIAVLYQRYFPALYHLPLTTIGLSSWAGFFYAICGYTVLKKTFGYFKKVEAKQNIE